MATCAQELHTLYSISCWNSFVDIFSYFNLMPTFYFRIFFSFLPLRILPGEKKKVVSRLRQVWKQKPCNMFRLLPGIDFFSSTVLLEGILGTVGLRNLSLSLALGTPGPFPLTWLFPSDLKCHQIAVTVIPLPTFKHLELLSYMY